MFAQYPYLNLNDFNLDYILKAIKDMRYEVTNFVSINAIKYANPIQWDITRQYEKNTIVIDPVTGTAYISVAPVPAGVALTRPEYWTVVFDLQSFVTKANQNLANHYEEQTTTTATMNIAAGEWVIWGDVLYKALVNITAGDAYVVGSNIQRVVIEDVINAILQDIADEVQARQDAVNAINGTIGDLNDLATSDKSSIVNAINEEVQARQDADDALQDADDALQDAIDAEVQARQDADGNLSDLDTTDKSNLVAAINEVLGALDTLPKPYVTPEQYGAVGDGVTDDTQAFIDCISNATGKIVILTQKYLLSGKISVPSNCDIIGGNCEIYDSWYNTTAGTNQYDGIFDLSGSSNVTIRDVVFKGTTIGAVQSATFNWRCDISGNACSNIYIDNCSFIACDQYTQISFKNSNNITVINCNFEWYRYQGIVLHSCNRVKTNYNTFVDCGMDYQNTYAIAFTYDTVGVVCRDVQCNGNIIRYPNSTPNWESIDAHGIQNAVFDGNILVGCNDGIAILSEYDRSFVSTNVWVINNFINCAKITGKTNRALTLGGYQFKVTNNILINGGDGANTEVLLLASIIRDMEINNNLFYGPNGRAITVRRDARFGEYVQGMVIQNNQFLYCKALTGSTETTILSFYVQNEASVLGISKFKNNHIVSTVATINMLVPTSANANSVLSFEGNTYNFTPVFNSFVTVAPDLITSANISNVANIGEVGHSIKISDFTISTGQVYELRKTAAGYAQLKLT